MTATIDPVPWADDEDDEVKFARNLSDGLVRISNMVLTRPDIARLLRGMFWNLISPVNGADDPEYAIESLATAAVINGGEWSDASHTGINLTFGPVRIWVVADVPPEPARRVVEVLPDSPVDEAEIPVEGAVEDADVLVDAESVVAA